MQASGGLEFQAVADARLVDEPSRSRGIGFELVAKLVHVNPEIIPLLDVGRAPDLVQKLALGDDLAGVLREEAEQLVLRRREMDFTALHEHETFDEVDLET